MATTTTSIMDYVNNFLSQAASEEWDHEYIIQAWNENEKDIKALVDVNQPIKKVSPPKDPEKKCVIMTPINLINPSTDYGKVSKIE
jgi:hypothetical protein